MELYGGFDILVSNAAVNPSFGNFFEVSVSLHLEFRL